MLSVFSPPLYRIDRVLEQTQRRWGVAGLRFPPDFEAAFERATRKDRLLHSRLSMIIAMVIYNCFLLVDHAYLPQLFHRSLVFHIFLTLLIAPGPWLPIRRVWLLESIDAMSMIPFGAATVYLHNEGLEQVAAGQMGFMLMLMYVAAFVRPRFSYVASMIGISVLADSIYLIGYSKATGPSAVMFACLMATEGIIALLASHRLESRERVSYLLRLHIAAQNRELAGKNFQLARLSNLDPLTGIPNRRFLDTHLAEAWAHCAANGQPCSILMIDLDRFKSLNDCHGHAYGDIALCAAAQILQDSIREEQDIVARYGGEEFAVILPNRDFPQAISIAERICATIRDTPLPPAPDGGEVRATVSVGVAAATPGPGSDPFELVDTADQALYAAKRNGRDQVFPQADFESGLACA